MPVEAARLQGPGQLWVRGELRDPLVPQPDPVGLQGDPPPIVSFTGLVPVER